MIIDAQTEFSDAQTVTVSAASTNVVDTGHASDVGLTDEQYLVIQVDEDVTRAAGAATVTFKLQTDDADTFGGAVDLWTSAAIAKASLKAGTTVAVLPLPTGCERYLRTYYTVSDTLDGGKFSAFLTSYPQTNKDPIVDRA